MIKSPFKSGLWVAGKSAAYGVARTAPLSHPSPVDYD